MGQKVLGLMGYLVLGLCTFGKCSTEDNEITPLADVSGSVAPPDLSKIPGFNVNLIVDGILAATRTAIRAEHVDQIVLNPVESDFNISLAIATLTAHVKLINGTFRALDSIERHGDARIIPRILHREFDVVATLGLKTAVAEYYYYFEVLGIHPNGNLTAVVRDNSVHVKFALSFDGKGCHLRLSELKMTKLEDVDVTLTGLYPFDTWSSRLATSFMEPLKGELAETVETTLRYYIEQEIHKVPCAKE